MGEFLFRNRGWLPIPALGAALVYCEPPSAWTFLGLGLIPFGLLMRLWAMLHIGPAARSKKVSARKLVYTGPYELSRNPLYVANIIAYTGAGVATLGMAGGIFSLVCFSVYYSLIVRHEEEGLERRLGEIYRSYRNRVPRWLGESAPVHAAEPKGSMNVRLSQALRAERSTFAAALVVGTVIVLRAMTAG